MQVFSGIVEAMQKRPFRLSSLFASLALCAVLIGCTVDQQQQAAQQPQMPEQQVRNDRVSGPIRPGNPSQSGGKIAEIYPGSGAGNRQATTLQARPTSVAPRPAGDITLNFEDADIREVAQVVLRDLLQVNYVIDPDVQGRVSFRTAQPLTREQLLPTLESLLHANNLGITAAAGVYRVSRGINAGSVSQPRNVGSASGVAPRTGGGNLRVFPLRYVSAEEMGKILKPVLGDGRLVLADSGRGLLIVQGSAADLKLAEDTVGIFDVDMLAGQTVLLESLLQADAATLALELENLFQSGKSGMLDGAVRIIPIERMNAVMVITAQPRYIEEARNWIARLDRTRNATQRRLFVYYMQNGKAAAVARTLRGVFGLGEQAGSLPAGLTGQTALSNAGMGYAATTSRSGSGANAQAASAPLQRSSNRQTGAGNSSGGDLPRGSNEPDGVRIIADEANNAILAYATPAEYQSIEETLSKLDLVPLQVLIEASIVEVALNDSLRFGVQYYLRGDPFGGNTGVAGILSAAQPALNTNIASGLDNTLGGLSVFVTRGGSPRVVLDALSSITELNMISSPSLLVLDNQIARLQVGSAVPIITQSVVAAPAGSVTPTGNSTSVANAIDYRDTGVMLEVVPRVNASGLVTLEIAQEVSDVTQPATTATIQSPTINQRRIVSTVAVNSGDTVVLGGLIRDSQTVTDRGIPGLHRLPLIGSLFGSKGNASARTELMVMLTPRVIRNQREARDASQDLQRKFQAVLTLMGRGISPPPRNADNIFAND